MSTQKKRSTKCKHTSGWLCKKNVTLFVFPNGDLRFDFDSIDKDPSSGIVFICNSRNCHAERKFYLTGKVVRSGKVYINKEKKQVKDVLDKQLAEGKIFTYQTHT